MTHSVIGQKVAWRLLRIAGLLGGLGFMAWMLIKVFTDPQFHEDVFFATGFIEAIGIGIIANAIVAITFSDMIGKYAPDVAVKKRITAFYYAQVAKYIPGKIASLMVQRSVLSGLHATSATLASNLELMAISCWLCGGSAVALLAWPHSQSGALALTVVFIASGAQLLKADWGRALRLMFSILRKGPASATSVGPHHKSSKLRAIVLSSAILILPAASSYVLLVNGMGIEHDTAIQLCAMLALSWIGGLLAFIFPAGIGVRELIFFALGNTLTQHPEAATIAAVALFSRIVQILIDTGGIILFIVYDRATSHRETHEG